MFITIISTILVFFSLLMFMLYKVHKYKLALDEKNMQIIQYYLDTKFMWRCLLDNLSISDSVEFCSSLIEEIKNYYNLEDIVIIDSINMISVRENTLLRASAIEILNKEKMEIISALKQKNFLKIIRKLGDRDYVLYISAITPDNSNDGVIMCIEQSPSLLDKNEAISLENAINILKTRLMYS